MSEYGLLNENLLDLESMNKIAIQKLQECFTDEHSGLDGYLYVIRRVEKADFKPKNVPKGPALKSIVNASIKEIEEAYVSDDQFNYLTTAKGPW